MRRKDLFLDLLIRSRYLLAIVPSDETKLKELAGLTVVGQYIHASFVFYNAAK